MPVVGSRTDLTPLSSSQTGISPAGGHGLMSQTHPAPRHGSSLTFSPTAPAGYGPVLTSGCDPPLATASFCVAKGKDIRERERSRRGTPSAPREVTGDSRAGRRPRLPLPGEGAQPGDILCCAGGRALTEGGAGRARRGAGGARRAHSGRGAAMALAAGSRAGRERMAALLVLYLPLLPGLAGAFNLDTDNVVSWSGETGSLFGFSLAMHRQLQPQEKRL